MSEKVRNPKLVWWFISLMPTSAPVLDLVKGAWLGQICRMIVCNQFRCIPELRGKDPRGLLIGTGIPSPADDVRYIIPLLYMQQWCLSFILYE